MTSPGVLLDTVAAALKAGIAVVPPREDGSKAPLGEWKQYQKTPPAIEQVRAWYTAGAAGIGVLTGAVSGGLEMLELEGRAIAAGILDDLRARAEVSGLGDLIARIEAGYTETTPGGGRHWLYRVASPLGNTKLARRLATAEELEANPKDKIKVLIETRGEGGYVITAPSNGKVHPDGGRWTLTAGGFETIATITEDERAALFELCRTFDRMPVEPLRPPASPPGSDRPGDRYNDAPDAEERMEALLVEHGWTVVYRHKGVTYLRRPGKSDGISATLGHHPGLFYVFSTSTEFEEGGHRPFGVYAKLEHGGDFKAAAAALADAEPRFAFSGARARAAQQATAQLPPDFWQARTSLSTIKQAAHARQLAPDAVLGAVMARVAAMAPHTLALPAIVAAAKPLNIFSALVGPPGTGKSGASEVAAELVPASRDLVVIPSGSGEGLIEAFFEYVEVEVAGKDKTRKEKHQAHHNLYVFIDEGQRAMQQAKQTSSTLMSTYCSAFMGSLLGDANASLERKRVLEAGSYSIGIVAGFQPMNLAPLLDGLGGGGPERFTYFAATDPTMPEEPPTWPGALDAVALDIERDAWRNRASFATWRFEFYVNAEVEGEIRSDRYARVTGKVVIDEWGAHRNLIRLKLAAILAILDGNRLQVTPADWRLAGIVVDTSDAVREQAMQTITALAEEREEQTSKRLGRRAVHVADATREWMKLKCAEAIARKVIAEPGQFSPSMLRKTFKSDRRDVFDDALPVAIEAGWIVEDRSEPGQGQDKVRLWPGQVRP